MDKFTKIDLSANPKSPQDFASTSPQNASVSTNKFRIQLPKRTLAIVLGVVALLLVGFFFAILLPVQRTFSKAMETQAQARLTYDAVKKQNIALAGEELAKTKTKLAETQDSLHAMSYFRFIPIVSGYYNDANHAINAGFHGIKAAEILVDSLKPYADVLGLKGQGSFVMGSAEQRIQTAVLTMGKITPRIDEIAKELEGVRDEINQVNPNHYPSFLGGGKIRMQLEQAQTLTDQGVTLVNEARPLIKVLPSLLGESKERKYLVLFQNDKELRPTGGFITAYAIFRLDKGIIHIERSDDIYSLDNNIRNKPKAPEIILKYLPNVTTLNLRDSNVSPDFVTSMVAFREMYDTASNAVDVDGIVAIDTHVLVSVLKILDDEIAVSGITFTTKTDKRCDCPQVIYVLEDNISRPVGYVRADRKGLIGDLLYALMQKALKSSPKVYWGPLFQDLLTQIDQKHVMFYLFDKNAQAGIEALNSAGRIKSFEGDYLHINEANLGGQKANLFTVETVTQNIAVKDDGVVEKTITITYKNPYPPSDCNLERGGLCLNATLRDFIRVYVPKGSQLISNKGSEVKVGTKEEFGKTVFEGFLTVRPQGAATYQLTYRLPFKLEDGSSYPLFIQKQPGTAGRSAGHDYVIEVNGKKIEEFKLASDKKMTLKVQ